MIFIPSRPVDEPRTVSADTRPSADPDPFGFRYRFDVLRATLRESHPDTPEYTEIAYHLAIAAGHCLLTGGTPTGGRPTHLPMPVAVAALRHLRDRLPCWQSAVADLRPAHAAAESVGADDEADRLAYRWVLVRTDVWALLEAVRDSEARMQEDEHSDAPAISAAMTLTLPAFDRFDAALEACKSVLATQCQRSEVRALRDRLAAEYRQPLPWWLDPASFPAAEAEHPKGRISN